MRLTLLVSGLLVSGAFAIAQENATPRIEVGANYSLVRYRSSQDLQDFTQNGGSGYIEYNLNRVVGLVGDFGGYYNGTNSFKTFSYLGGPRFNWRMSKFDPYVQFLFGGTKRWTDIATSGGTIVSTDQTGFTSAAGAGLDIALTRHIAVKPAQVEYVMSQLPLLGTNTNTIQNNLRYSAGVVFRFGGK